MKLSNYEKINLIHGTLETYNRILGNGEVCSDNKKSINKHMKKLVKKLVKLHS
jgi:hypothetical protein